VAAHKSVAVLGVIGRADDMHAILDAETAATMAFLDAWFQERGGRRGREQVRTATSGLTWCATRHATSRAGDPAPHDHVLVANVVEMLDQRGGWKALDTASLRDVLHAATIVGRAAAAHTAVELGYGIEPDDGPSGRCGTGGSPGCPTRPAGCSRSGPRRSTTSWTTAASAATGPGPGQHGPPAAPRPTTARTADRAVAGRPRAWVGHRPGSSRRSPGPGSAAERRHPRRSPRWCSVRSRGWRPARCSPVGTCWSRSGRRCFGLAPGDLEALVDQLVASEHLVPRCWDRRRSGAGLRSDQGPGGGAGHRRPMAALAVERGPAVDAEGRPLPSAPRRPSWATPLTAGQEHAVRAICTSGRRFELVVGVAGAGKTTAIDAAAAAFRSDGDAGPGDLDVRSGGTDAGPGRRDRVPHPGVDAVATRPRIAAPRSPHRRGPRRGGHDRGRGPAAPGRRPSRSRGPSWSWSVTLASWVRSGPGARWLHCCSATPRPSATSARTSASRTSLERHALDALRSGDVEVALGWYRRHHRILLVGRPRPGSLARWSSAGTMTWPPGSTRPCSPGGETTSPS
jgi:hypothetical protein